MRPFAAALLLLTLLAAPAFAHRDWIAPNGFKLPQETSDIAFTIASGERFFTSSSDRLLEGLGAYRFECIAPNGKRTALKELHLNAQSAEGSCLAPAIGTYTLALTRLDEPAHYAVFGEGDYTRKRRDELDAGELAELDDMVGFSLHSKAFVAVGEPTEDWKKPLGQRVEFVPLDSPFEVAKGKPFRLQVLAEGKPLANNEVKAIYEGYVAEKYGAAPVKMKTDANGIVTLTPDRPGLWLMNVTNKVVLKDNPELDYINYKANLFFDVGEDGARGRN